MSQYATLNDLQDMGLPPGALEGVPDPDRFLAQASAHVDSYLRGRYALPLSAPFPAELVDAVLAIAAYRIMFFRGFDSESQDMLIVDRFQYYTGKQGQKGWLDKLSTGQVNLALAADSTPTVSDGGPIVSSAPTSYCTSRSGRGWSSGNGV
jgi:phage gp36-like protein